MTYDWVVVGAGFAGSVLAERLANDAGERVLLVDRRPHIGGNAYDHHDDAGVPVHRYGPHIFHTNSAPIIEYLSRFTAWRPYQHRVLASVDGQLVPLPINLDTINRLYGLSLDGPGLEAFFEARRERRETISTSEDVILDRIGSELYQKFFRNYTRKQWGMDASELDSSVISRVPIRTNRDDRYADRVERLHAVAPGRIAASCGRRAIRFAHLSSALVLSGPGPHSESAELAPRGDLGRAQALGEARSLAAHPGTLVIRCGEIVGADRDDDRLARMLQTLSRRGVVGVPDPASAVVAGALVEALLDLLVDGERGVWHLAHRRPLVDVVAEAARIAGFDPHDVRADPSDGARLTTERGHVLPPLEEALHTHWDPRRSRILEEVIG